MGIFREQDRVLHISLRLRHRKAHIKHRTVLPIPLRGRGGGPVTTPRSHYPQDSAPAPAPRSRRGPRDYPPIALSTGQCSRSRSAVAEGAPYSAVMRYLEWRGFSRNALGQLILWVNPEK